MSRNAPIVMLPVAMSDELIRTVRAVRRLVLPDYCPVCGNILGEGERILCLACQWHLPLTGMVNGTPNAMSRLIATSDTPIEGAYSYFFFKHGSPYRHIIHRFKYAGRRRLAYEMGKMFAAEIIAQGDSAVDIDVIVPVPIHLFRLFGREYNQSDLLAEGVASVLGRAVDRHSVVRSRYRSPQVGKRAADRHRNVEGVFSVRSSERLAGKHLLILDDVFTTGATLGACCRAIHAAVPTARLSIAALAVNELIFKQDSYQPEIDPL